MKVARGSSVTLPVVPSRLGYINVGWSTKKNGKGDTYRERGVCTPDRDCTFYAVQEALLTVSLYTTGAIPYRVFTVEKGTTVKLPGAKSARGKTTLGWSKKRGQKKGPQYEAGEEIRVTKSLKLYAVVFPRSEEPDLGRSSILKSMKGAVGAGGKYSRVIFVGDSRTFHMSRKIQQLGASVTQNVYFVCRSGTGLRWLKETGVPQLMKLVRKNTAVIFNHGVNSLGREALYVPYMKELGKKLRAKGCRLFYMSVNPVNNETGLSLGKPAKPEELVRRFNSVIKEKICGDGGYTYLDCYTYLMYNGYGTATTGSRGRDTDTDDGLHFTTKTCKRIYAYCMRRIAES